MSQTQLSNFATAAGVIAMILAQFGITLPLEKLSFALYALWTLGWTAYNFWQRYQKGDITLGGFRKSN